MPSPDGDRITYQIEVSDTFLVMGDGYSGDQDAMFADARGVVEDLVESGHLRRPHHRSGLGGLARAEGHETPDDELILRTALQSSW